MLSSTMLRVGWQQYPASRYVRCFGMGPIIRRVLLSPFQCGSHLLLQHQIEHA